MSHDDTPTSRAARIGLALAGLYIVVALIASTIHPADAATTAPTSKRATSTWIQPPSNLDTFSNIYGSRHDGYTADHWDPDGYWANTLYPPRRVLLFQYCPNQGTSRRDTYACQTAWDDFYTWLRQHRDGTRQDWIDQQYPHIP